MHMHGVHGAVGAAAAVARLRGLDRAGLASALAVAAGLTLGTSWRTALEGATVRNAYAGVGGASGWLAVDLATAGLTGLPDMLSETFGRISGQGLDEVRATELLGARFEVARNYFKLHACCRFNHPALDALEAMLAGAPVGAAEVDRCRVVTNAPAATMSAQDPVGSLGAKFSIPYALAARLVLGTTGPEAFREPALSDPRIRALARRVEVVADPALTAELPARRPAVVVLHLADGRRLERRVDIPGGEFDHPYPVPALEAKFAALAAGPLGEAGGGPAFALCRSLDRLPGARDLTEGLRALAAGAPGRGGPAFLAPASRP
jgi:2-methylcitrate dehydratase PrpD